MFSLGSRKDKDAEKHETEIVFGTDTVIKRRREIVIKTKIAEKGTASETVNESGIATTTAIGIGIDIAEMIKTATGVSEKSEISWVAKLLPMLSLQGLIAVVCLFAPMLRGTETHQMMTLLGKEEELLTMR